MKTTTLSTVLVTAVISVSTLISGCTNSPVDSGTSGNSSSVGNSVLAENTLAGRIITVDDSIPVGGAKLTLRLLDSTETYEKTVTTDNLGSYKFVDVKIGAYTLFANKDSKTIMCDNKITVKNSDGLSMPDKEAYAYGTIKGMVNFIGVGTDTIDKTVSIKNDDFDFHMEVEAGVEFTIPEIPEGEYQFRFVPSAKKFVSDLSYFPQYIIVKRDEVATFADIDFTYLHAFELESSSLVKYLHPDSTMKITMNEVIASVESASLINSETNQPVALSTNIDGKDVTITVDGELEPQVEYLFSISIKNGDGDTYEISDHSIIKMASDNSFIVTETSVTDAIGKGITGVPTDEPIIITMADKVKEAEFELKALTEGNPTVSLTISYEGNKVIITPNETLQPNTYYALYSNHITPENPNQGIYHHFQTDFKTGS